MAQVQATVRRDEIPMLHGCRIAALTAELRARRAELLRVISIVIETPREAERRAEG
jgi:hypothetical protein